jgi:hypothetical protein
MVVHRRRQFKGATRSERFFGEEGTVHHGLVSSNGPFALLFLLGIHYSFL